MERIAIVTDSNSGLTKEEASKYGIYLLPMKFYIEGKEYTEGVSITFEEFFERLRNGENVSTTQPAPGEMTDIWDELLKTYDKILHIPMSRALSGGYSTAVMMSGDYDGKVLVVDNSRISVTLASAVIHAKKRADAGASAQEIKKELEELALEASIYITVDTLEYLRKGGRIGSVSALAGEMLNIRPVIQLRGGLLEPYCKVRGRKKAKKEMEQALYNDVQVLKEKFGEGKIEYFVAHADAAEEAEECRGKMEELFPGVSVHVAVLPMSIGCHVGPGTLGIGVCVNEK